MKSGGMCCTITIPGAFAGNPASNCCKACTPPVLTPTAMIRSLDAGARRIGVPWAG